MVACGPMTLSPPPPAIHVWPLPYEARLPERSAVEVDLVVVHCTELPDLATAREYGQRVLYDSGAGNSGHYYIDRDGSVHLFVRPNRIANPHAIGLVAATRLSMRDVSCWFRSG